MQVTPLELVLLTVKTSCVLLTEVIAAAVPLATPLMLAVFFALPPVSRVISMVGAVPLVSNTKPAGAVRMMVPLPTLPLAFSE
jgi:hypothetical protein